MSIREIEDLLDYAEHLKAEAVARAARKAAWKPRAALSVFVAALFMVFVYVESKAAEHEYELQRAHQAIASAQTILELYKAARTATATELNQCVSRLKGRIGPFRDM